MRCIRVRGGWVIALALLTQLGCKSSQPGLNLMPPVGNPHAVSKTTTHLPADQGAMACVSVAQLMESKGREADAIPQYERARELDPRADVAHRLAVCYDRIGNSGKALAEFRLALQNHPKDANILNDIGYFYLVRDDFAEAEKHLRLAVERNPKHKQAWGNLALALGHQGKDRECLEAFQQVVSPAEAHYNLAVIMVQSNRQPEARSAAQQALSLDPTLHRAKTLLAFIDDPKSIKDDPYARKPKPIRPVPPATTNGSSASAALQRPARTDPRTATTRPITISQDEGPLSLPGTVTYE